MGVFYIFIFLAAVVILPLLFLTLFCIRKIPPGYVGVRVGFGGYVISDTWIYRIPLITRYDLMDITVQKLEIERKGQDGLICQDNIRADIVVAFYLKVNYPKVDYPADVDPTSPEGQTLFEAAMNSKRQARYDDVKKVAQTVGCKRAADIDKLRELFEAKFSEALKTAGKEMEFTNLYTERMAFREKVIQIIELDLNGYALEDVAIDYLEQTPIEYLDPNNVLDAEGIRKITMITSAEQEAANERIRQKEMLTKQQDIQAQIHIRELERRYEEFLAQTQKQLDEELAKAFPNMEKVEEIRAHIWKDHFVWDRFKKLEEEVELLKSQGPNRLNKVEEEVEPPKPQDPSDS
ncbi:MAG: SPFH domain-containing protein [Pirellulaceae bacterium]